MVPLCIPRFMESAIRQVETLIAIIALFVADCSISNFLIKSSILQHNRLRVHELWKARSQVTELTTAWYS